jgi:hypothetical protein
VVRVILIASFFIFTKNKYNTYQPLIVEIMNFPYFLPVIMMLMYIVIPALIIIGFFKVYSTFKESVKVRQEQNEIFRELVAYLKVKNDIK